MKHIGIYHCYYCDRPLSRRSKTRDHMQPRSRNGSNSSKNIVDACRTCNTLKGCLSVDEFRVVMAFRMGVIKDAKFEFPGEIRKSLK
jgi:5-methylcytosine-specific restriction endonuclease McrA